MTAIPLCETVCGLTSPGAAGGAFGSVLGRVSLPYLSEGAPVVLTLGAPGDFQPILSPLFEPSSVMLRLTDLGDGRLQYDGPGPAAVMLSGQAFITTDEASPVTQGVALLGFGINDEVITASAAALSPANDMSTSVREAVILQPGDIVSLQIANATDPAFTGAIIDVLQATLLIESA